MSKSCAARGSSSTTCASASPTGEINVPLTKGELQESDVAGDIGAVITGKIPGRTSADEVTLFDSTGIALQDSATPAARIREGDRGRCRNREEDDLNLGNGHTDTPVRFGSFGWPAATVRGLNSGRDVGRGWAGRNGRGGRHRSPPPV